MWGRFCGAEAASGLAVASVGERKGRSGGADRELRAMGESGVFFGEI